MSARRRWTCRSIVLAFVSWSCASAGASAQTPDPEAVKALSAVKARVPAGDVVKVTDATGATIKGRMTSVTPDAVQVAAPGGVRRIAVEDVRHIQWRRPDALLNGTLTGAAIGAAPGIYWLIADPNECNGLCPEEYGLIAAGALVGALIDRAVRKEVTVYSAVANPRRRFVSIAPLVTKARAGASLTVRF
jgi:hypothetical protein